MDVKRWMQRGVLLAFVLALFTGACPAQNATSAETQRQAAIALEQKGDSAGAEAAWRAVLESRPKNAEAYAHLGLLEARQEHYSDAVTLYRKAMALDPAMPELRLNLGLSLFKSGALKESIQTFEPLLKEQSPSSLDFRRLNVLIGMAHYALGEYVAAVPYLKQAAADDPRSLQLRLVLAESCMGAKQYPCVLDVYRQILMLNADSAEADMLAGDALEQMHDDPDAVRQFRAAVKENPHEPNVHFGLGYLLWRLKQYREASQQFEAELANVPDHVEALAYLGDAKMHLQQPAAALPLLERASRLDPDLELARVDLGTLYLEANRPSDAQREFEAAVRLSPKDPDAHWRLARFYQATGKTSEARAEFITTRNLLQATNDTGGKAR